MIVKWVLIGLALALAAFFLMYIVCALIVDPRREYDKKSRFYRFLLLTATHIAVPLTRIKMHVSGEKLPEGRFLLVCNHRSKYDPIVTLHVFKDHDLAFISKGENFREPIIGRIIRKCCFMAIDRENPRNAIVTINKAAGLIKKDETSVCVYPEGTRSRSGELLPFHNGVFKIAQKSGAPIAVMTVQGTENIMKNFPWHTTHVYLNVTEVISAERAASQKTSELAEHARELMMNSFNNDDNVGKGVIIHNEEISGTL